MKFYKFYLSPNLIDKTLLLTVRSIEALFSRVKGYFPSKNRGDDRV